MPDAHRGVVYTQKVVTDPSVGREMTALGDRAQAIQKMLGGFRLGGLDLSQFQTGVDRAHASLEALHKFALEPATIGAPSMAPAPGVVSHLATYPAATLPPAAEPPEAPEAPIGEFKDLKLDLEKMAAAHKAAEDKLASQTQQSAQARAAANAAAAKVQAQQEAELTARAAAEADKRGALPERVVRNRIAMLARLQKFEADKEAAEQKAAAKQAAQLQKTADAEQKAAEKQAAAEQKAAEKQAAAVEKVATRRKAQLDKETEADKKYWESFVKFGEESQKKRAEQNERASEEHERAVRKLEGANIRLRRHLTEALVGATELARGFTELGLVGEQDMEKIKDAILGVQSAVDLIHGGVSVWNALAESARLYQERLVLIKEAEEAAAAVHAVTSTAGAVGSAGTAASGAAALPGLAGAIAAAGPLGIALAALTAAGLGAAYAINKYKEAAEEGARRDREERQKEISIRQAQNAAMLSIFQAEKTAREQMNARENLALRVSQQFGAKRGEYESAATAAGYKSGASRDQFVGDLAAIDANKQELAQAQRELAAAQQLVEKSRNAEKTLPTFDLVYGQRLREIAQERGRLSGPVSTEADPVTQREYNQRKLRELDEEERRIRLKGAGGPQFDADQKVAAQAAQQAEAALKRINELKAKDRELERDRIRHEIAWLNEEIDKQRQILSLRADQTRQAKEAAKAAKDAAEDALAGFGRLSTAKQRETLHLREMIEQGNVGQLTRKQLEKAGENGDARMKAEANRELARRGQAAIDASGQGKGLFSEEKQDAVNRRGIARGEFGEEMNAAKKLEELIRTQLERINSQAAGGEKGEVHINAKGEASVQIKWDEPSSKLIAAAMKQPLREWREAIHEMLDKTVADVRETMRQEIKQMIQAKSQKGAAGF